MMLCFFSAARNHVNRMCLAADIPLIESGTAGYLGQVTVIKKVVTWSDRWEKCLDNTLYCQAVTRWGAATVPCMTVCSDPFD